MRNGLVVLVAMGLVSGLVACGATDRGDDSPGCVPGTQSACSCPSGETSVQICLDDYTYDRCACDRSSTGKGGSAGSSSIGNARGGASGSTGGNTNSAGSGGLESAEVPGTKISQGNDKLVDVFVGERGIYVILDNAAVLYDRAGSQLARQEMPREVTAAAFDGTHLVVADKGKLTSFDADLKTIVSADLLEGCAAAVMVSGNRFVCGPSNDWDRVIYTYDALTAKLLKSSKKYTYNGIPMRRVDGRDDFITTTIGSSPTDLHLYSVDPTGEPIYINESPYHGDFAVNDVFAFNGSPATHVITHAGLMLRIYGDACKSGSSSFEVGCFMKDGALGTLSGGQVFLGMENDAGGKLYGLVDPSPDFSTAACDNGCLLQRIDIATKTIEKQTTLRLGIGDLIAFRYDTASQSVVLGYRLGNPHQWSDESYPGHSVTRVGLE